MKKVFFYATMLVAMFLASCEVPEGNDLLNRVEDLESRVEALEKLCAENNTNISSLKTLVDVINSKEMIEAVIPIASGDKILGYTITFSKRDAIIIYSAMDANGTLPVVGVKAESGVYYWTLNGEWLLDDGGKKIAVSGKDGITPQLKIENGFWWVSYDGKATWEKLGEATGENSGNNSAGGECMIKEITDEGSSVRFTLADDTVITIAKDPNAPDTNAVFTITYKANGGEGEDVVNNVKYGRIHLIGYTGTMEEEGDEVEFTKEGLVLVSWNTKPDGTGETYKRYEYIVAQKNITLYAQWKKTFNLTLFYGNNGNIRVTDGYFDYDYSGNNKKKGKAQAGEITLEAYSYDGGEFVEWSDGVTDNPRTVTINSDTTFTAIFTTVARHRLSLLAKNGIGTGTEVIVKYKNGTSFDSFDYEGTFAEGEITIDIDSDPQEGIEFVEWNDGNTDNPRTIQLNTDITLTATFIDTRLTLTTYPYKDNYYGAGYVNVNGNSRYDGVYKVKGGEVVIEAEANSGYEFVKWSDGNTDNPRTIQLNANATYSAIFEAVTYDVPATMAEAVDLGLSVKWASCNVGASRPEEYGSYFAWGETKSKGHYYSDNYKLAAYGWASGEWGEQTWSNIGFSKYITEYYYDAEYDTPVDNKTTLEAEDDAATVNMGGSWRMPTYEEWNELRDNCTWTATTLSGVRGYNVEGPNGNSIFLPAAGKYDSNLYDEGSYGYYWSSSLYPRYDWRWNEETDESESYISGYYTNRAYQIYFHSGNISSDVYDSGRYKGYSVRGVRE